VSRLAAGKFRNCNTFRASVPSAAAAQRRTPDALRRLDRLPPRPARNLAPVYGRHKMWTIRGVSPPFEEPEKGCRPTCREGAHLPDSFLAHCGDAEIKTNRRRRHAGVGRPPAAALAHPAHCRRTRRRQDRRHADRPLDSLRAAVRSAATMATAAHHLAFDGQHLRLLGPIWRLRRNIGDCCTSFGVCAATSATAAPHLAFAPQHRRPRRLIWHLRRNIGDRGTSFGICTATIATAAPHLAFAPQHWRLRHFIWRLHRNMGDRGTPFGVCAATSATAAPHLAFAPQHWRLRHLIWHRRRNIGDCGTSFGVCAATLATAAPHLAFAPQHWRLRHIIWRLRRNIGDCGTSFGVCAATPPISALPLISALSNLRFVQTL